MKNKKIKLVFLNLIFILIFIGGFKIADADVACAGKTDNTACSLNSLSGMCISGTCQTTTPSPLSTTAVPNAADLANQPPKNCVCSAGGTIGIYTRDAEFVSTGSDECRTACIGVQNAKYFSFSDVANVGFRRIYNCLCVNGSLIPFNYPLDSKFYTASDDECNQQCANRGTTYYSYSNLANLGTSEVTKTPIVTDPSFTASNITVGGPVSSGVVPFTNPLRFSTVEELLGTLLSAVQKIIVTLALVFIVIGAVMILTSAGSSGMVESGKKAITMALVGLAVGIAAPSILKELANVLGWSGAATIAAPTLTQIALKVLNFLLGITGLLALIMMVIGAIMYLTSAGNEDQIGSGKKIFKYALIGIVLAMASMVLVRQVAVFFL